MKRTAVHVEDHPLEYLDFEGVIPRGEYGAGDVIVWDRGTWEPHATDDPAAAVAAGELHVDVHGDKLRGRLILIRRRQPDAAAPGSSSEQWLLVHKHDEDAVPGWGSGGEHPASVLSGRTNEEVKADPERMWRPDLPAASASVRLRPEDPATAATRPARTGARRTGPAVSGPAAGELAALDALGDGGTWEVFGRELRLDQSGQQLFPGRPGGSVGDQARADPVPRRRSPRSCCRTWPGAAEHAPFPGQRAGRGFWHKQLPDHAPGWVPRWHDPGAGPGKNTTYLVADEPAVARLGGQLRRAGVARLDRPADQPDRPSYALIDIDPGHGDVREEVLVLARLTAPPWSTWECGPSPAHRPARHPDLDSCRPGAGFQRARAWVEQLSRAIGAVVPQLVSWKWDVHDLGGLARLDYTQNASNKTLVAPYSPRAAGRPVSAPLEWDELDEPRRADAFTIRDIPSRSARTGDPFRTCWPAAGLPRIT